MISIFEENINPSGHADIKLHHIGYACKDISETLEYFKSFYNVEHVSQIIHDPLQKANLCLLTIKNSTDIELVSGEPVKHLIKNGTCIYHLCYETNNIEATIDYFKKQGGVQLDIPTPAKLFDERIIVFMQTKIGLIELLESKDLSVKLKQKVIITGTFSVDSVKSCLSSLCERYHFPYEIESLNHDSLNISLVDKNSDLNNNKLNIILVREQDLTKKSLSNSEKLNDFINALIFSASQNKTHFILGLCPSVNKSTQSIDDSDLINQLSHFENITLLDLRSLIKNLDDQTIYDEITDREAQIPYKSYFDKLLASRILKKIYACYHNTYKVVVVDCDDTLWTGMCGEDVIDKIKISETNALLQKKLKSLREKGFLIFICSKNHEDDVKKIFSEHPDMILTTSDITAWKINWHDKSSNLKALSDSLNISLSSFIFIDDNPLEIAEVEANLSEVLTLHFTKDTYELNLILNNLWAFDKEIPITQADERNQWYSAHFKREEQKTNFKNIEDFIASLKLNINIAEADHSHAARLAELSHRVTQFNFTNKKYNTHEITTLIDSGKNIYTFKVDLTDKYGDYGLVGLMIISIKDNSMFVESFMLSCRALNRDVEKRMLYYLADLAKNLNIRDIIIPFTETLRNLPAKIFLETLNANTKNTSDGTTILTMDTNIDNLFISNKILNPKNQKIAQSNQSKEKNLVLNKEEMFELLDINTANFPTKQTNINNNRLEVKNVSQALICIWKGILKINSIRNSDDFFNLGGNSLSALRLLSQICEYFKIDMNLHEIFQHSTFYDLLCLINSRLSSHKEIDKSLLPALTKQPEKDTHDLSYNQKSLWLLDKLYHSSWFYNISSVHSIKGNINISALDLAIHSIIKNNNILRSNLSIENYKPRLVINKNELMNFEVIYVQNLSEYELDHLISKIQLQSFNLYEQPLYRLKLLKRSDQHHILVLVFHHIIFDGWSEGIFNKQLQTYYRNYSCNNSVHQISPEYKYIDFITWQKSLYKSKYYEKCINYWAKELENFISLKFPSPQHHSTNQQHHGKYYYFKIPDQLYKSLNQLKNKHNTTLFTLLYSAFLILLHKYTNETDITIGFPVSGRFLKEFESIIGNFVSTLPIRSKIEKNIDVNSIIHNSHKKLTEAYEHQFVPFQDIVNRLKDVRFHTDNPIYQVMLVLQDAPNQKLSLDGLEVDFFKRGYNSARMNFIIEFNLIDDILDGGIYYDVSLFDATFVEEFSNNYTQTLEYICFSSASRISDLYYDSNISASKQDFKPVHELFEIAAYNYPAYIAVKDGINNITYSDLENRANFLAIYLYSKKEIRVKDVIILHLKQNIDTIVCILACFKLGATYVPIEPSYPNEFKNQIIHDCESKLLITNIPINLPLHKNIISLDKVNTAFDQNIQYDCTNRHIDEKTPAYIIYTSGTTGKPKGIVINHSSIANLISGLQPIYNLSEKDSGLLFHSFCFDFSVWEIWSILAFGGKLVITGDSHQYSSNDFWNLIVNEKITILNQTPSVFENFLLNSDLANIKDNIFLRLIIFGGEALYPNRLLSWFKTFGDDKPQLYNMYGITETTVHATYQRITKDLLESNKSLIGNAIPGLGVELFSETHEPVKSDEEAEIYVSGIGLSPGYFKRDELTSKSFIKIKNKRWYKTGDLARRINGNIEYLGRSGDYVKVRGYRISPNYISAEIEQHAGIYKAALLPENNRLLCLLIPEKFTSAPVLNAIKYNATHEREDLNLTTLPNGIDIFQHNKSETLLQYQEIFLNQEYTKHHITLNEGDTVIDVGANIGMFSLFFGSQINNLKIYAFEPIPEIYSILKSNLDMHQINATCVNNGLSNKHQNCDFTYFPNASVLSGINPDQTEVERLLKDTIASKNIVDNNSHSKIIKASLHKKQINAEFFTLSEIIKSHHIEHIHLLKVDVERHELEVLQGISKEYFELIDQIIVEVHDFDERLKIIKSLLNQHGFLVNIEKPSLIKDKNMVILYARKSVLSTQPKKMNLQYRYKWLSKQVLEKNVKDFLKEKLPTYMIPTNFKFTDQIPTTNNGKIDYKAICQLFHKDKAPHSRVNKSDKTQNNVISKLSKCWEQVLEIEQYDYNTNFFDLGGDSFSLVTLHHMIGEEITNSIELIDLFTHTTINQQAKYIESMISGEFHG